MPAALPPRTGFIGLGLMGQGLARNARKKGQALALLVRSEAARERLAPLLAGGDDDGRPLPEVMSFDTAAAVAAASDIVVLCVTGAPEVEQVVFGECGLLQGLRAGSLVVDCSTSLPDASRRIARELAQAGVDFLDAPMTGTPVHAEQGEVNLLAGGDAAVLERARPRLSAFARSILHCGGVGAGHTLKLLHQFIVLSNAAVLAEAFALAKQDGLSLPALCEVIGAGGANSTAFQRLKPYLLEGDDQQFRFSLANAAKDMDYYTRTAGARAEGLAESVLALYRSATEAGMGDAFVPRLVDVLAGK